MAAPFMGAWIEMLSVGGDGELTAAAPFMGAWIEIATHLPLANISGLPHPSWVRGLKFTQQGGAKGVTQPHPSWVRGLKSTLAAS